MRDGLRVFLPVLADCAPLTESGRSDMCSEDALFESCSLSAVMSTIDFRKASVPESTAESWCDLSKDANHLNGQLRWAGTFTTSKAASFVTKIVQLSSRGRAPTLYRSGVTCIGLGQIELRSVGRLSVMRTVC